MRFEELQLEAPMFIRPPKYVCWSAIGKCLWGGETGESVLEYAANDPEGPALFLGQRIGFGDYEVEKIAQA